MTKKITKDNVFFLVLLLMCLATLIGISKFKSKTPSIRLLTSQSYDFGTIKEGEIVSHDFMFKNVGHSPLQIKNMKSSCACTGLDVSNKSIGKGGICRVTMTYKGRHTRNPESATALIETNDSQNPFIKFHVKCRVKLNVFWYPKTVSIQGDIHRNLLPGKVTFQFDHMVKSKILRVYTSNSRLKAWAESKNENEIIVIINPSESCEVGNWAEKTYVDILINDNKKRTITIPVNLMMRSFKELG